MRPGRLLLSAFALTLVACDSAVRPDTAAPALSVSAADGAAGSSATGRGVFLIGGVTPSEFKFVVKQHENGQSTGSFSFYAEDAGLVYDIHGRVTCSAFDPASHRAWIAGIVTHNKSTDPAFQQEIHQPGHDLWFRVLDNGAEGDRMTFVGFEGTAGIATSAEYCERRLWLNQGQPVVEGEIVVVP